MTCAIETRDFQIAYREAIETIAPDADLSFRLPASSDELNLRGYLSACETLYVEALEMLRKRGEATRLARVLDAGGSFGAFAAALHTLGVEVVDSAGSDDPVDVAIGLALHGQTASASTIANHGSQLGPNGRLVLVVPSSQYLPRRLAELRGRRPSMSDDGAVELDTPSYGRRELRALLSRSGLRADRVRACDYSPAGLGGPLRQTVSSVVLRVAPRHREAWLALASRDGEA